MCHGSKRCLSRLLQIKTPGHFAGCSLYYRLTGSRPLTSPACVSSKRGRDVFVKMTPPTKRKTSIPIIDQSDPRRPNSLLRRLSSGFLHALPPFRASSPRNDHSARSTTAPNLASKYTDKAASVAESEQLLVPQLEEDVAAQSEQSCPYDPDTYHSFASIEKRRCSFCGMRGPKIKFKEPCEACRTGAPGSHITSSRTQVDSRRRHSAIDPRQLAHLADSSSSVLLGPRPVTPERTARRIGNPPRVSRLPPGIIRLPVPDPPESQHRSTVSNSKTNTTKQPTSPRLHYLHGLPGSENFPFVHSNEIPQHAIALSAGSTSPLTGRTQFANAPSRANGPPDYSNTVQYGGGGPSLPGRATSRRNTGPQPQVTTVVVKEINEDGKATIDLHASPLDTVLSSSQVYRRLSLQPGSATESPRALADAKDSATTNGSQDTRSSRLGDMRLELKGGNTSSEQSPRLRGGIGHIGPSTNTLSFKLKRFILTCHGPCPDDFDTDSDADLPPPRIVSPERVAKAREKMNGRAPLPSHLCRGSPAATISRSDRPGTPGLWPSSTFTAITPSPPKSSRSFRLPAVSLPKLFRPRSASPINQPAPHGRTQVFIPPIAHLRGGAGSGERIPPTLFWLAGGTGRKPITFSSWTKSRPGQRMGGLFGMAVFGDKYGQEFRVAASAEGDMEVSCSASVRVSVGGAPSVRTTHSSTQRSRAGTVSGSTSSSRASVALEPVDEGSVHVEEVTPATDSRSMKEGTASGEDVHPATNAEPSVRTAQSSAHRSRAGKVFSSSSSSSSRASAVPDPITESIGGVEEGTPATFTEQIGGDTADVEEVAGSESIQEDAAREEEVESATGTEPAERGLTPPPSEHDDDIPLCSGALPVEPTADEEAADSNQATPSDAGESQVLAAGGAEKEGKS